MRRLNKLKFTRVIFALKLFVIETLLDLSFLSIFPIDTKLFKLNYVKQNHIYCTIILNVICINNITAVKLQIKKIGLLKH